MFDSGLIWYGEIRCQSLLGLKGLILQALFILLEENRNILFVLYGHDCQFSKMYCFLAKLTTRSWWMHQWKQCLWRQCILYQHCGFLLLYLQGRIHWRWTLVFRYIIILISKICDYIWNLDDVYVNTMIVYTVGLLRKESNGLSRWYTFIRWEGRGGEGRGGGVTVSVSTDG